MNFFAGIFWLVLSQLQIQFFLEHLPVVAYVTPWKKKNERNDIVCFYCTQSTILLCGIARFSRLNKNKLRTFQPQKWKRIKKCQPQTKFTGCWKKKSVLRSKTYNKTSRTEVLWQSYITRDCSSQGMLGYVTSYRYPLFY